MRQQFEQKDFYRLEQTSEVKFEVSELIRIAESVCLVQELNTREYKQTFVQVDKFLKKMNRQCPQIASFLFISENHSQEHLFYLVFEFGQRRLTRADFARQFTQVVDTLLRGLAFLESIQLFYPSVTLDNLICFDSPSPSFKLINQFCFQEVFRFVVEYLLNVKISDKKKFGILDNMKRKALREFAEILAQFSRDEPILVSSKGELSNLGVFREYIEECFRGDFLFKDILDRFLELFDVDKNQNKGHNIRFQSFSSSMTKIPHVNKTVNMPKKVTYSAKGTDPSSKYFSNQPIRYSTINEDADKVQPIKYLTNQPKEYTNKQFAKNEKKKTRKIVIQHNKRSSGFYSMNDNKLDDLALGVRFSEIPSREPKPRTTIQKNFADQSLFLPPTHLFKKKVSDSESAVIKNHNPKESAGKDETLYFVKPQLMRKKETLSKPFSPPRKNPFSNRSTLMSQVQEEYNFGEIKAETQGVKERTSKSPNLNRHFSFSKNYNGKEAEIGKKRETFQSIVKSPNKINKIVEPKPSSNVRMARMSENLYQTSSKISNEDKNQDLEPPRGSFPRSPRGTGLRRSSSSSFIKKENEELKKKQMKRSIFNLQRQEKNDGVRKFGSSNTKEFRLKTHIQKLLSRPENQHAPQYLDFGDCPTYCYRLTVVKSDNNALADKRFFNNPRNFYAPQLLINLNSCESQVSKNISGQLISGLQTTQMNEITRLRVKSKFQDFETLVDFESPLKSSVYHNLDQLEDEFDLSEPVLEKTPSKPMLFNDQLVEKIDDVTYKMNGIEFKDLRGQKNVNVQRLKTQASSEFLNQYQPQENKRRVNVVKPESKAIRRVQPVRKTNGIRQRSPLISKPQVSAKPYSNLNSSSSRYYSQYSNDASMANHRTIDSGTISRGVIRRPNNAYTNGVPSSGLRVYRSNGNPTQLNPRSYTVNPSKP